RWRQRIYSIPFYVNADVFRRPSFVDPNNYPNWAANYTGGGPTSPSLSPFVHQSPANTLTFPHNSNLVISPNHSNSALPPWGTYTNENISSTAVVHYNTSRGGGTNWEAGLGKNNSGYLVGRSPNSELQRAAESDIIVLFTDAITDPENSSSWYANPAN